MPRSILILLCPLLLLVGATVVLAQTPTFAPQPYIYRIKVVGCAHAPIVRHQTGFLVRGEGGIVTALHGVADCPDATIEAESAQGDFAALTIQAVDIDRDVARLSSPDLADRLAEGLDAPYSDRVARTGLHALGYPYGKTDQEPTTQITVTYARPLHEVIPGAFITPAFEQRRSPDLETRVLVAEAHFVPGHSGAPVLNAQKQVIGVISGGLKEGYIGKSWLIPWAEIQWQPLKDQSGALNPALAARWALVQANDPELSLSFLSTYSGQTAASAKALIYHGRLVDQDSRRGIANAEVHLIFEQAGEVRFGTTTAGGNFEFQVVPNAERAEGLLWIHAAGYQIVEWPVYNLQEITRLGTITLDALPPTPTPTATATPTPEPTATPQPMVQVRIIMTGVGFASESQTNEARRKQSALLGAQKDANRNFVLWRDGADLEAVTIVDQGEVTTDRIRDEIVRTRVRSGTIIEQSYDDATRMAQVTIEYVVEIPE